MIEPGKRARSAPTTASQRKKPRDQRSLTLEALEERTLLDGALPAILPGVEGDVTPPTVTGLFVKGSSWPASFLNGLDPRGYRVPVGSADQLITLPWTNVDQIAIEFSEDVEVDQPDLELYGSNVQQYAFLPAGGGGFTYSVATLTATWKLAQPIGQDHVVAILAGTGNDPVQDEEANVLDGNWINPGGVLPPTDYPSGDGAAGGDFIFQFNVSPGNVNDDALVNVIDVLLTRLRLGAAPGSASYDHNFDVDASGQIDVFDVLFNRLRLGSAQPGDPLVMISGLADDTGSDSADGITFDASIVGTLTAGQNVGVETFLAGFDGTPIASFVDVEADLADNGSFFFDVDRIAAINGGPLSDGAHVLHLRATNSDNKLFTLDIPFTLDTVAPAAPTGLGLTAATDLGPSNSDAITSDTTPDLQANAETGSTIQFFRNGDLLGQGVAAGTVTVAAGTLVDGNHEFRAIAVDRAGNVSGETRRTAVVDSRPPDINIVSPAVDGDIRPGDRLNGVADAAGARIANLTYRFDSLTNRPIQVGATGSFSGELNFTGVTAGDHTITVDATDLAGNTASAQVEVTADPTVPFEIERFSPRNGEEQVSIMVRPQIFFSSPIDPATLNNTNFFASSGGQTIPANIVPANDGTFAWLFWQDSLPSSNRIEVTVDGSTILPPGGGPALDADGDGTPGGTLTYSFSTLSVTPVPGTSLTGQIVDPGPDLVPFTADDVDPGLDGEFKTMDDTFLLPIEGATIFILGLESQTVLTGANGRFTLDPVPVGHVKVVIDGRTSTNSTPGYYFPELVMDAKMMLGASNSVMMGMDFMQLPRVPDGILQNLSAATGGSITVSPAGAYNLTPEQQQFLRIDVPPNSFVGHDGQMMASGTIGLAVVPPELVETMLPPGVLQHTFDITVQAMDFANLSTPAPMTFPNVSNAPPGSKLNLLSFDHTTGLLVIEGTATVSADGLSVSTDPGTGISHPGWHGLTPPGSNIGFPGPIGGGGGGGGGGGEPPDDRGRRKFRILSTNKGGPLDNPNCVDPEPGAVFLDGNGNYFHVKDDGILLVTFSHIGPSNSCPVDFDVTFEGPADQILESTSQIKSSFRLHPGDNADKAEQWWMDIKDLLPTTASYTEDTLFGVKVSVKMTNAKTGADIQSPPNEFYVYRLLDVADATHDDGILSVADTLADGTNNVVRTKNIRMRLSPGQGIPTFELGDTTNFRVTNATATDGVATITFDPVSAGEDITTTLRLRTPTGQPLQPFQVRGDGIVQQWSISETALANAFANVPSVVMPSRFTTTEQQLIDDPAERTAIAQAIINRTQNVLYAAYGSAFQMVAAPTPNSIDVVTYEVRNSTASPAPVRAKDLGIALGSELDRIPAALQRLNAGRANINASEFAFRLSEILNENLKGSVEIYVDSFFEGNGIFDFISMQQIVNTNAHNLAHELGHELSLLHSAGSGFAISGENATNITDIIGQGTDYGGTRTFSISNPALLMSLGMPWTDAQAVAAWQYYSAYLTRPRPDLWGNAIDAPDGPIFIVEGPRLALFDSSGMPVDRTLPAGTVNVDGAGGAQTTVDLVLQNYGTQNVILNSVGIEGFGSFTSSAIADGTVLVPGETLPFTITFDPTLSGGQTATLLIESNDPTALQEVELSGFGLSPFGDIAVSVPNNNVGGRSIGAGAATVADFGTIENIGALPLTITDFVIGAGAGQFVVSGLPAGFGPGNPIVLQPGESIPFDVEFDPNTLGLQRGEIRILSSDPDTPSRAVRVVGTGRTDSGTNLDFGNDFVVLDTPMIPGSRPIRVRSDADGNWSIFTDAETSVRYSIVDPVSGLIANQRVVSALSGQDTGLPDPIFHSSTDPDSDGDGLPDDIEFAIGTAMDRADTDNDGTDDFAEVILNGTDPFGGRLLPIGVVAAVSPEELDSAVTSAREVVVEVAQDGVGQTAYVATTSGLSIVDVTNFQQPVVLGRWENINGAEDVAVDRNLGMAAVTTPGQLHILDIRNPANPIELHTLDFASAGRVEAFEGRVYVAVGFDLHVINLLDGEEIGLVTTAGTFVELAREQATLYSMESNGNLSAFDITTDGLEPRGSVIVPELGIRVSRRSLFVGNGVAYVARDDFFNGGFSTVDVSDPDNLAILSGIDDAAIAGHAVAVNGAGLGILVGAPGGAGGGNVLDVVSVVDPANTGATITRVILPAEPLGLALSAGIAYVANGTAGLQIVNYLAFDNQSQAPTINLSALNDADPNTPGAQIIEGGTVRLQADVTDDFQVRNVELLRDGVVVSDDITFPFDLAAIAIGLDPDAPTITVQARATDTAGNVSLSNPLTIDLVPDTFGPVVQNMSPIDGSRRGQGLRTITVKFNEALDPATVTADNFVLQDVMGFVVAPERVDLTGFDRTVQLTFPPLFPLPGLPGNFTFSVNMANVKDRAGNSGSGVVVSSFEVVPATIFWVGSNGEWDDPLNWDQNRVPNASDIVLIDVPGNVTVTSGGNTAVDTLFVEERLTITGGALTTTSPSLVRNLNMQNGFFGGNVTLVGVNEWSFGDLLGTINNTGVLNLTTGNNKQLRDGTLTNSGTISLQDGGTLFLMNGTLVNQAGAVVDFASDASIVNNTGTNLVENNGGTIRKSAGMSVSAIPITLDSASGTFDVRSGQLNLSGGTSAGDTFQVAANAAVDLTGGGNRTYVGTITGSGDGAVLMTGGFLQIGAAGATFNFPGDMFQWSFGDILGNLTNASTSTINLSSGNSKQIRNGTLTNNGTIRLQDGGSLFLQNGTFANSSTGLLDFASDGGIVSNTGTNLVENNGGTIRKSGGTGTSSITVPSDTEFEGEIDVDSGTLSFDAGGSNSGTTGFVDYTVAAGARLRFGGGEHTFNGANSISGQGAAELSGGTVRVLTTSGLTINLPGDGFFQANGYLNGDAGTLTNRGLFEWSFGDLTNVTNADTGVITLTSGNNKQILNGTLTNNGTVRLNDGGALFLQNGTLVNQGDGGLLDFASDASILSNTGTNLLQNNRGTVRKSGGTGTSSIGVPSNTEFEADIEVDSGTLSFDAGGSNSGITGFVDYTVAAGARLRFGGGEHTFNGANSFTGQGAAELSGGTLRVLATSGLAISLPGDGFFQTGGHLDGGAGNLTNSRVFEWSFGDITNLTNTATGAMTLTSGNTKQILGGTLTNNGTITIEDAGTLFLQNGTLANNGGIVDFASNASILSNTGTNLVTNTNAGQIRKTAGAGTSTIGVPTSNNAGFLIGSAGNLSVDDYTNTNGVLFLVGGSLSFPNGLDMSSGQIRGFGTLTGNVTVRDGALIAPDAQVANFDPSAAILTIDGNYTQMTTGTLRVDAGGTAVGTQFDQLQVTGTATLDGTLALFLFNGFAPNLGQTFQIVTAGLVVNQFATVTQPPDMPSGRQFSPVYGATDVTLAVLPALQGLSAEGQAQAGDVPSSSGPASEQQNRRGVKVKLLQRRAVDALFGDDDAFLALLLGEE